MKMIRLIPTQCCVVLTLALFLLSPARTSFAANGNGQKHSTEAQVETSPFGVLDDGTRVDAITLTSAHGAKARIITYGATLTELWIPDRAGKLDDVVLGYENVKPYIHGDTWFGATVGPVANRIARGEFTIDGKTFHSEVNNGPNTLHSGSIGLSHVVWKAHAIEEHGAAAVRFSYTTTDGEWGFPGSLQVEVTYLLTNANELKIRYSAKTDKTTPVNLTNHSYFNLDGGSDVLNYKLTLFASHYTPVDAGLIPTGEILPVAGTALDFTKPAVIGDRISELPLTRGYDHNFVADDSSKKLKHIAHVLASKNGRVMDVWTTEPAVQLYTGNFLNGTLTGKRGVVYGQHSALCLETQHYPDSVHHENFPSTLLHPGETFTSETVYKFSNQ
jgi:aldose 1-epimerase